jgi:hypothetical protein
MHPEILRELGVQHRRDLRVQASRATAARTARRTLRATRRGTVAADEFVVPDIPDYVDGSFRTDEVPATTGHAA